MTTSLLTDSSLTSEQREDAGISAGLIRLAVGLETVTDLQADLARGFSVIAH